MRTKIEAGWTLVRAATDRACRYASGAISYDPWRQQPAHAWHYGSGHLQYMRERCLADRTHLAIDLEFDRNTKRPFNIGMSIDGETVANFVPTDDVIAGLREVLDDDAIIKVLHHAPADAQSLATLGIYLRPPIYDTLMMYATIYPDLPVGLERVALHLFDHWHTWKDMAHDDPAYNAIDVAATWRIFPLLCQRMDEFDLWPVYMREVRHVSIMSMAMEARGLCVDPIAQRKAVDANDATCATIKADVTAHVDEIFARRRLPIEKRLAEIVAALAGITQPRLKKDRDPLVDAHVTALRKERGACESKIERWSKGFDLGNNDHLRWLLYDAEGFKLSVQKNDEGRPTANADAIARLLALKKVQESPAISATLVGIKEYQHAMKMTGTFLYPWVDHQVCAHPEYRPFGTGTGRMAGGPDSDLGDKQANPYSYNSLNIPQETRQIYVPHPITFTVDLSIANTEVADNDDAALAE